MADGLASYRTAPDGRILHASGELARLLGFASARELEAARADEMHEDAALRAAHLEAILAARGMPVAREIRLRRRDGQPVVLRDLAWGTLGADGSLAHVDGVLEDVTERLEAERRLAESERRYRELVEDATDVIYTHTLDGRFLHVNRAATALYGHTEQEFLSLRVQDLVEPDDLPRAAAAMAAKGDGHAERTGPYELRTRTKGGGRVWLEVTSRLMRDGERMVIQGIGRDITGRKRAEAALGLMDGLTNDVEEAPTLDEALRLVVRRLAEVGGWSYAEAWVPDGATLRPAATWHGGAPGMPRLEKLSNKMRFAPGEDLPGRAWGSRRSEWLPDLRQAAVPRAGAAQAAGLTAGAAVPMMAGDEVVAVLVMLEARARDDAIRWLDVAEATARHVGNLVARRRAIEAWRSHATRLGLQFQGLPVPALLVGADGTPLEASASFLEVCGTQARASEAPMAPLAARVADVAAFQAHVTALYGPNGHVRHRGRSFQRVRHELRDGNALVGHALYLLPGP